MAGDILDVVPGEPVESNWGNSIRDRVTSRYADRTQRDLLNPFPQEGQLSWIENTNEIEIYNGTVWVVIAFYDDKVNRTGDTMSGTLHTPAVDLLSNSQAGGGIRFGDIRRLAFGTTASIYDAADILRARTGEADSSGYVQRFYRADGSTVLFEITEGGEILARETDQPARVEIFPRGTLLDAVYLSSSATPGGSPTVLVSHTVTLEYPGQPVIVDAAGLMRSSDVGESDGFQGRIVIDGTGFANARALFPSISQPSHTHSNTGITNTASSHTHGLGGTSGNSSTTPSVNVGSGEWTVSPIGLREFTPAGSTFDIELVGEIRSGSPGTWFHAITSKIWRA